jgi:DNA-binding PucR family transcriptional regulator
VQQHIAHVAGIVVDEAESVAAEMDDAIFGATPVLASDATIEAETRASVRANLLRWLRAAATHPERIPSGDAPPEVLDLARTLVRRGIEFEALANAYRQGQNVAWRRWMRIAVREVPADRLEEVLERSAQSMFGFVDGVLASLLARVRVERAQLLGDDVIRRAETVRLVLDGAPIEQERASRQLGYDLRRRHTALVLWAESPDAEHGALEETAAALARSAGAHRPLMLPAGGGALWVWLGTDVEPDVAGLRGAMDGAPPGVRAALGSTGRGISGFRRSHLEAIAAQRLLAGDPAGECITAHREVEVMALAAQDEEQAAEFVASVLGPLGTDDAATRRLRETLRVYLEEGENGPRTARRLNTHRNTVLHRVARAEEVLGHPVGDRRLALAVALELAHRLGPRVLPKT